MTTQTIPTPKEQFLGAYDQEHATTMKVLRAYPEDKWDSASAQDVQDCPRTRVDVRIGAGVV